MGPFEDELAAHELQMQKNRVVAKDLEKGSKKEKKKAKKSKHKLQKEKHKDEQHPTGL